MIDFLTNPWVIAIIVMGFIGGNIAALKYATKFTTKHQMSKMNNKSDLDKLIELDKKNQSAIDKQKTSSDD